MQYRAKPVVVEAFQMTRERRANNADWPAWLNLAWSRLPATRGAVWPADYPYSVGVDRLMVHTDSGVSLVDWDDYIVRDQWGGLQVCRAAVFAEMYESCGACDDQTDGADCPGADV